MPQKRRQCVICSGELPERSAFNRRTCSEVCRRTYRRALDLGKRVPTERKCLRCGSSYFGLGNRKICAPCLGLDRSTPCSVCGKEFRQEDLYRRKTCSKKCRYELAKRTISTQQQTCAVCGETFLGRHDKLACSSECRKRRKQEWYRKYRVRNQERIRLNHYRWREQHPGLAAQRTSEWIAANPERHNTNRMKAFAGRRSRRLGKQIAALEEAIK